MYRIQILYYDFLRQQKCFILTSSSLTSCGVDVISYLLVYYSKQKLANRPLWLTWCSKITIFVYYVLRNFSMGSVGSAGQECCLCTLNDMTYGIYIITCRVSCQIFYQDRIVLVRAPAQVCRFFFFFFFFCDRSVRVFLLINFRDAMS